MLSTLITMAKSHNLYLYLQSWIWHGYQFSYSRGSFFDNQSMIACKEISVSLYKDSVQPFCCETQVLTTDISHYDVKLGMPGITWSMLWLLMDQKCFHFPVMGFYFHEIYNFTRWAQNSAAANLYWKVS